MKTAFRHRGTVLAALAALSAATLLAAPFIGSTSVPLAVLTGGGDDIARMVFWKARVPTVLVAFLAGTGLALCGMAFQALFRNPLAEPYTLGVSSGASLGAAVYISLGLTVQLSGFSGIGVFAFAGAALAVGAVWGLTRLRSAVSIWTMLLAGVAVSAFCSGLILFVQYVSRQGHSVRILHWLMGGLDVIGYRQFLNLLPFVFAGTATILTMAGELNLLTTGEDIAASRGVDVKRARLVLFLVTSLAVAGIVSICGPIGFVGLMVPHICRLLVGADHRWLGPASAMFGGLFLVACDRLARVLISPADMPVGIITALLGGPFFLWLLVRRGPGRLA